jgi:GT2 family glycosyltransferase
MIMEREPLVSLHIVVRNGENYIRHCLDAVRRQTYRNIEVTILDNASTDATADIVAREYPAYKLIRHSVNLGMWPGHEHLLPIARGEYLCALSVDVILDANFVTACVQALEISPYRGAIQGKIYQYQRADLGSGQAPHALPREMLDTCGFALTHGRKVVNLGHGSQDTENFSTPKTIFGVEGAVPFFRKSALESCRVEGHIWDPDFFWYGDDLDLAWRMNIFGYQHYFEPRAVAWHDRSTTKGSASTPILGQIQRRAIRAQIPLLKRRLDWSNIRFTIIKNDYIINLLRDFPLILAREIAILGYTILFEPKVLFEIGRFFRLLPSMLRRRRQVMRRATIAATTIHDWFL